MKSQRTLKLVSIASIIVGIGLLFIVIKLHFDGRNAVPPTPPVETERTVSNYSVDPVQRAKKTHDQMLGDTVVLLREMKLLLAQPGKLTEAEKQQLRDSVAIFGELRCKIAIPFLIAVDKDYRVWEGFRPKGSRKDPNDVAYISLKFEDEFPAGAALQNIGPEAVEPLVKEYAESWYLFPPETRDRNLLLPESLLICKELLPKTFYHVSELLSLHDAGLRVLGPDALPPLRHLKALTWKYIPR